MDQASADIKQQLIKYQNYVHGYEDDVKPKYFFMSNYNIGTQNVNWWSGVVIIIFTVILLVIFITRVESGDLKPISWVIIIGLLGFYSVYKNIYIYNKAPNKIDI